MNTLLNDLAEEAWSHLNFDNDPHDGQPHNTANWNELCERLQKVLMKHGKSAQTNAEIEKLADDLGQLIFRIETNFSTYRRAFEVPIAGEDAQARTSRRNAVSAAVTADIERLKELKARMLLNT